MLLAYALCEDARLELETMPQQTAFLLEQPEDPARYRSKVDVEKFNYMSMWRTKERRQFQAKYSIDLIHLDQGAVGHVVRKPTTLAIVLEELKQLNELRGAPASAQATRRDQMTMKEKCQQSKEWASWAPGMKKVISIALARWLQTALYDKHICHHSAA